MSQLHQIDRPNGHYKTVRDLEKFMIFCILDTACTYKMVCNTFDYLEAYQLTSRKALGNSTENFIKAILKVAGYRFPSTHAKRLKAFGDNNIDLRTASREEMVKNISGIGMKLASFFLRNTRGEDMAVMDVHTKRWLYNKLGKKPNSLTYNQEEEAFKKIAKKMGYETQDLDLKIWQENRVGNK